MNSYKKLDLFYLTQLESRLSSCLEISRGILKRESEVVKSYNNILTKSQIFSPERPGLEELENQMKLLALDREDPHRLTGCSCKLAFLSLRAETHTFLLYELT
jgi:hypothetical protein